MKIPERDVDTSDPADVEEAAERLAAMSGKLAEAPEREPVPGVSIEGLLAGYRDGSRDPAEVVARAYERARSATGPAWISLVAVGDR